ncbi:MAG TPA: hypothetical protein V6D23_12190 [Candidatus Obscuribacterales bacterium]
MANEDMLDEEARFLVEFTVLPLDAKLSRRYTVCTLLGSAKAVAWATLAQHQNFPAERIFMVSATRIGPGSEQERQEDLIDRMEY